MGWRSVVLAKSLRGWHGGLNAAARIQGGGNCTVVEVIQFATYGHALRQRRDSDAGQLVRDVMRGGLPVDGGTKREDHFGHVFGFDPVDQFGDAQFFRPHRIKRGQGPAEHVIAAFEGLAAFHSPQISDVFDDANLTDRPFFAFANIADVGRADVPTVQAFAGGSTHAVHGFGQRDQLQATLFDQMQHGPPRRPRSKTGQLGEQRDQVFKIIGATGHVRPPNVARKIGT